MEVIKRTMKVGDGSGEVLRLRYSVWPVGESWSNT